MSQVFDFEQRTLLFSQNIISTTKGIIKNTSNNVIVMQLIRSATSIGANYLEAGDSLGKKDFLLRMKIARKEAKETIYWLKLLINSNHTPIPELKILLNESIELKKILSSMINNSLK